MKVWAPWLYKYRAPAAVVIFLITGFFAWKVRNLDISTHFLDLYPRAHSNVKLFEKYPDFGSPLTVTLLIKVKHGTIYQPATLHKIQEATRLLDLIPGVDHNSLYSLAAKKVKHVEATVSGIQSTYLLVGKVPETPAELAQFRDKVRTTGGLIGTLVSAREEAALVHATFIERLTDYDTIFKGVNAIIQKLGDSNHELSAAGQPMLTGWVYHYQREMYAIFGIGFLAMMVLLASYFRNLEGVVVPVLVGLVSGIWGFGFAAVLGYNLDPLIIVVPILLVARALSHSVQMCERYFELYYELRDRKAACIAALVSLFTPGVVGIICDAAGLFLIAIAPIRLIQKLAYVCGLWSLTLILTAVILTFLLLSFLPPPRNAEEVVLTSERERGTILYRLFSFIASFSSTPLRSVGTCAFFVILAVVSAWTALHRQAGDVHPGTSLLWPNSPYNSAVKDINQRFAGFDALQVVLSTSKLFGMETAEALTLMERFERYMERDPDVGGTFSFADFVPATHRLFRGGLPKWEVVPDKDENAASLAQLAMGNASPGDFDLWLSLPHFNAANITVWYKDHRGETIERALARARAFANSPADQASGFTFHIAAGTMGLLAAVNETIGPLEVLTVLLISLVIFAVSAFTYRSVTAGLLLVLISNMAYLFTAAIMYLKGIGLDVDTFPVAAVGMGIGIDYNIYLMSRMCDEYRRNPNYAILVPTSIFTTGKAIFFTATTMVAGVIIWDFLSSLRFQADMGLLLTAVMIAHVVLALFFQAAVMRLLQPTFIQKGLFMHRQSAAA
jgi:uncharacterized protein